jgi:hypothetical protein
MQYSMLLIGALLTQESIGERRSSDPLCGDHLTITAIIYAILTITAIISAGPT